MDRHGAAEHRRRLLDGLAGTVIEVGAGDGANFAHDPDTVTQVVAVEPEPYLRARAQVPGRATVPVEVVEGTAERQPAGDRSVDAAVVSLVLCSVADRRAALGELFRVLRPGGGLRYYEHFAAEQPGRLSRVQRLADGRLPRQPRRGVGDHGRRVRDRGDRPVRVSTGSAVTGLAAHPRAGHPPGRPDGCVMTGNGIDVRGLSKSFGAVRAVDDLTFSVAPGTVTAFLGPNGAGKTTTLRMLVGLVRPDAGTATIAGQAARTCRSFAP